MDESGLLRLFEEQGKALKETNSNIQQWEKFRSDYKSLRSRLKTLPDKITHDIMVPFGPLAFMPGQLVHTNEILVLLGDNWFVERSSKQACEIIDRRVHSINKEIENLQKQKQLLQPRLDAVTNQFSRHPDVFEITEEYDEEKEKMWREQHKKNVQAFRKSLRETKEKSPKVKKEMTDEDLWERLDELEQLELERKEMHKVTSDEILLHKSYDSDDSILSIDLESGSDSNDLDINDQNNQEPSSGSGVTDDEDSEGVGMTKIIRFSHNSKNQISAPEGNTEDTTFSEKEKVKIISPADIYTQFYHISGPKSILKEKGMGEKPKKNVRLKEKEETKSLKTETSLKLPVAFSGSVIEHPSETPSSSGSSTVQSKTDKPERMSRFKARRQGLEQT